MHYTVLAGHDSCDLRTSLFGRQLDLPFFCAPTAGQRMFHHRGEEAAATVCAEENTLFCLSALGTTGLDEVAAINPNGAKLLLCCRNNATTVASRPGRACGTSQPTWIAERQSRRGYVTSA